MPRQFLSFFVKTSLLAWLAVMHACPLAAAPPESREAERANVAAMTKRAGELCDQGNYTKAIEAGKSAVSIAEKTFGRDDPRTGAAKRVLAKAYLAFEDKIAAAPLIQDAIAILERADPPDIAALSYAVGDLAQSVESDDEAERLFRRALALAENAFGQEHSGTGHALNNLGAFLHDRNRAREAEPFMRRALHIRERTKGLVDPLTAQSLCTLGSVAQKLGEISIAESLARRSLEIRRSVRHKGHPDLAESCSLLAVILLVDDRKDRAQEALGLATEAVDACQKSFGPDAIRTFIATHLKADALAALRRQKESERLHQELIAKYESLPGPDLDRLADALDEFAGHMFLAGKPEKAVELYRRTLSLYRKAHDDNDGTVLATRLVLTEALYASHKIDDAVKEAREVVAALEKAGGDPQPIMGDALYSLAKSLLATAGGWEEARPLLRRSMSVFERTTGRGSQKTLKVIYLLAVTSVVMGELREAELLVDDGLDRFAAQDDVRTGGAAGDLISLRAVIYRKTGRLKEAEEAEAVAKRVEAEERRR